MVHYYEKKMWFERALDSLENVLGHVFIPGKGNMYVYDNVDGFLGRVGPQKNSTLDLVITKVGADVNMCFGSPDETINIYLRGKDSKGEEHQSTLLFYGEADANTMNKAVRDVIASGEGITRRGFNVRINGKSLEDYKAGALS